MPPEPARVELIVNADDLGWSAGVNAGILEAYQRGIVTSTTLAANMPAAEQALKQVLGLGWRGHASVGVAMLDHAEDGASVGACKAALGVGVHLNACQGPAMSAPGRSVLAGEAGLMRWSGMKLISRCAVRPGKYLPAIAAEFDAQMRWCADRGLVPTHADSHRHIHAWPGVFEIVTALCRQYGIRHVRRHRERLPPHLPRGPLKQRLLSRAINRLARRGQWDQPRAAGGLLITRGTWGLTHTGWLDAELLAAMIAALPGGLMELMVHPGYADNLSPEWTRLRQSRRRELEALCDERVLQAVQQRQVRLVTYANADADAGGAG
jgi:predicted glycoside hydrolase/deacetylase ChbG (UPF0249 family)